MSEGINTGFGFSKNAPLPTMEIVNALKHSATRVVIVKNANDKNLPKKNKKQKQLNLK
jgi:hypothetical protein